MSDRKCKSLYYVTAIANLYTVFTDCDNSSRLVQLDDCTCIGYTQTFECSAIGAGFTIWNSTFIDCTRNEIPLHHSQYIVHESQIIRECNHGAVIAKIVGVLGDCYTSQLIVTIGEEVINETIECVHDDIKQTRTIVGQKSLTVTEIPYPPPSDIHVTNNNFQSDHIYLG